MLHYLIDELFPKYQSGAKRRCLIIVGLRQLYRRDAVFHRAYYSDAEVCDSVSWVVEVSKGPYTVVEIWK